MLPMSYRLRMVQKTLLCLAVVCSGSWSFLWAEEGRPVITQDQALKAGPGKLTELLGDESENGMDEAALLYAAAKRLETETSLAARDLSLVLQLDLLRGPLARFEDEAMSMAYIIAGGGTMWGHQAARNAAGREDLLADIAKDMPLKESDDPQPSKAWAKVKEEVEKLALPQDTADLDPEAPKQFALQKQKLLDAWEALDYAIYTLPPKWSVLVSVHAKQSLDMFALVEE
jgi:hypothetical protein